MSQHSPQNYMGANLPRTRPVPPVGYANPPYNNYTAGERRSLLENIWASPSTTHRRFSIDFGLLPPEPRPAFADPFAAAGNYPMAPPALAPQPLWAPHVERWTGERWVEQPPQVPRPPPLARELELAQQQWAAPDRFVPLEQYPRAPRHSTGELFGQPITLGPALGDRDVLGDRYDKYGPVKAEAARNDDPRHARQEERFEREKAEDKHERYDRERADNRDVARSDTGVSATPERAETTEEKTRESGTDEANALSAVHAYFSLDPHKRVKVTAEYLERRFFDEEKYLDSLYQLPKFPLNNTSREHQLVLVGFKAGRVDVFYLPDNPALHTLQVGDLVMVEADRGKDLGKILKFNVSIDQARLLKLLDFLEQQAALNEHSVDDLSVKQLHHHEPRLGHGAANAPPILHAPKAVLALAQPHEVQQILNKKQDEEKACRLCLSKLANAISSLDNADEAVLSDLMHMKLIDAEYQFDRRKLIFYYSTTKRIDFRDLVRELFRIYKTRIWMCAVSGAPVALKQRSRMRHGHAAEMRHDENPHASPPSRRSLLTYEESPKKKAWVSQGGIPRKFNHDLASAETPMATDGGESLVLKSLVDTLDR